MLLAFQKINGCIFLSQQATIAQIIPANFITGDIENLASIPFFISLLTILNGIILKMVLLLSQ
jgi:hypothetical protein